ncbi:MAG TPA: succinate dehydrogenase, hydrophobic membrane anchor protein [Oleiagrimonas sp.]|nr:succinate dehydrogenase, hydrophobic membrane anchor protein [Oleiagrimonas sp.]
MSTQQTGLRDPLARARGLGSAKAGVGHWWVQRITATALIALGLWFVCTVIALLGSDFEQARAALAEPWNAVLMIVFVCTAFWHAQLGLQVVIEDYVHTRWKEVVLTVGIRFLAILLSLAGSLAVLRVAFAG